MKKILFLIFFLSLIACKKEKVFNKNDWENDALTGEVASYRIVNYLAAIDLGEVVPSDTIGANGRVVYNEQGYRIEEFWHFNGETSHRTYRYENNNCVELLIYTSQKTIEERGVFTYNSNGFLQEEVYYNANDELTVKMVFTFDKEGNMTELLEYAPDETLESLQKSKYRNKVEIERYTYYYEDGNALITKLEFVYDKENNLKESTLYDDAKNILGHWVYSYDQYHNLLSEEGFDAENVLVEKRTYTYKYDEKGNWIERITFDGIDNEPRVISQREFVYFK